MDVKNVVSDFKKFAFQGNVLNMAVGVMVGGAFGKIVTSLVNDIFMPLLSLLTGRVNMSGWFVAMNGEKYPNMDAATQAGVATLNYGFFIQTVIDFALIAICVFFMVRLVGKISRRGQDASSEPPERLCPYCLMDVKPGATRCPHCAAEIGERDGNVSPNV